MTRDEEETGAEVEAPKTEAPETEADETVASDQTLDAIRIIELFGGIRPMATKIDVAVTTVQGWKNRGVIPESRRDAIEAAAIKHSVNLNADAPKEISAGISAENDAKQRHEPSADETPSTSPQPPTPAATNTRTGGGGGVAWLAVIISVAALALSSHPYWGPSLGVTLPNVSPRQPVTTPDADARAQIERLNERIVALETTLTQTADRPVQSANPELTIRLEALESAALKLETQESARSDSASPSDAPFQAALTAMEARLAAAENSLLSSTEERTQLKQSLATTTETAIARATEMTNRLNTLKSTQGSGADANSAALGLAISGLDSALATDQNFALALNTARAAIKSAGLVPDATLNAILTPLQAIATSGAPSLSTLARQFDTLAPSLARRESVGEKSDWMGETLNKLYDVVSWRRLNGPVDRAAEALSMNKLSDAVALIAATAEAEGAAKSWIADARKRIAVDTARQSLRTAAVVTQIQSTSGSQQ
ncbi:MAG: hypothetical protein ACJAU6_000466 [Alphaproteobacteria bacterium]|jgi:hypothetical protein